MEIDEKELAELRRTEVKPPIWYKEPEIRDWLLRKGFYRMGLDAQVTFITTHLQLAFEKGFVLDRGDLVKKAELWRKVEEINNTCDGCLFHINYSCYYDGGCPFAVVLYALTDKETP